MGSGAFHVEALIAALVEARVGLHYRAAERPLFDLRVGDHARDRGFDALLDYYYHLRYDDPDGSALDDLIESLLVHETYFFRELRPLTVAVEQIVAPVLATGRRARIWSAACSTGEEPLSIAMLLAERGLLAGCDIVATDVSERALAMAKSGRHRPRSLRSEGLDIAARWLERQGEQIVVPPVLRAAIDLRRLNLCDAEEVTALGRFDLVVCRHVLIYFDDARVGAVVSALANSLRPGGAVLVGVSESLMRFSTELDCEELDGTFFYRRNR